MDPGDNEPAVVSVEVTPATSLLSALDQTATLTATARDASNATVANVAFTWSSSQAGVVSVSQSGVATAVANGSADITATGGGVSGSATVTVDQVVTDVVVTPASVGLTVGDTAQLTAAASDANAFAVGGASITWSTPDTAVATVSGSGLVTAVAAGVATVSATSHGVTGSATITVGGSAQTVFFRESFENADFTSRGWYDLTGWTVTTGEAHGGSSSLELHFTQGATGPVGGGARHLFTDSESVYLSYWVKYSANWIGSGQSSHPHEFFFMTTEDTQFAGPAFSFLTVYVEHNYQSGGIPFLRAQDGENIDQGNVNRDLTGITENRAAHGCNGNGDPYPTVCYAAGGGLYNNTKSWSASRPYFLDTPGSGYKNDWHHVEAFYQLNSIVNGIGQADGVVQYWFDGQSIIEHRNVLLRTGAHPTMRFNQLLLAPFIGGNGSPADQTLWVDDLTVGSAR